MIQKVKNPKVWRAQRKIKKKMEARSIPFNREAVSGSTLQTAVEVYGDMSSRLEINRRKRFYGKGKDISKPLPKNKRSSFR